MQKILITTVLAASVGACSSVPKPVTPDGASRKPVNSEARISDYRVRTGEEQAAAADRSALSRQVAYLQGEIAKLKTYVVQLSTIAATTDGPGPRAIPTAPASIEPAWRSAPVRPVLQNLARGDLEAYEIKETAVVFRVTQAFAKAEFSPTPAFQDTLLTMARTAARIDVRGRTDAQSDNAADRAIALRRANCAQAFLLNNGVPAKKIRVSFLAAGGRIASNATPQGRAMNRRIEIETVGVDTREFRGGTGNVMGSL